MEAHQAGLYSTLGDNMAEHWNGPDHSGRSEAMALAERIVSYWRERGVEIKAWVYSPRADARNPMYHVRTNLCPVTMTAKAVTLA
jgi:hypothetical protein